MTTPIRPLIYQKIEKNLSNKSARQNNSRGVKNRSATIPRPDKTHKTHKGGEPAGSWVGQHWGGWWRQHGAGG